MKNQILSFSILTMTLLSMSCNNNSKKEENSTVVNQVSEIDSSIEIAKWKKELLDSAEVTIPCDELKEGEASFDALPKNNEINTARSDFDGDIKVDLLMYFMADNCSGASGQAQTFAKIVYANKTQDKDIMPKLRKAIIDSYKEKMKEDNSLKEVTDNYLEQKVTISSYEDGINGEFSLYTDKDAHCCPTYGGSYKYDLKKGKAEIDLGTIEVQKK